VLEITNSANNGHIHSNATAAASAAIGGVVSEVSSNTDSTVILDGNVNNGMVECYNISGLSVGGIVGYLVITKFNNSNNINNGEIKSVFMPELETEQYLGGLVGVLSWQSANEVVFDSGINKGHISLTIKNETQDTGFAVGGCFGGFSGKKGNQNIIMKDIVNEGNIHVSSPSSITQAYAGGLIGAFALAVFQFINCENRGDVTTNNIAGGFVGFIVPPGSMSVSNCVNKGNLNGNITYSTASELTEAHNVVSLGRIDAITSAYSLAETISGSANSIYRLDGNCAKCDKNDNTVTLFTRDSNGYYFTSNDQRVDVLLSKIVLGNDQYRYWTPQLSLYDEGVCVIVVDGNVVNLTRAVKCGTALEDIDEISKYVNSDGYVITDNMDETNMVNTKTEVLSCSYFTLNSIHNKPFLEIIITPVKLGVINTTEILKIIRGISGIDKDKVIIDVDTNNKGLAVKIRLYLNTLEDAEKVMNYLVDNEDPLGKMIKVRNVRLNAMQEVIESAIKTEITFTMLISMMIFTLIMLIVLLSRNQVFIIIRLMLLTH